MGGVIELMVYLAIIGLIAWLLTTLIPMPPQIKTVILVVAAIFCLLIILRSFGLSDGGMDTPKLHHID